MNEENYYYEFRYVDGGDSITIMKFSAEITIEDLAYRLRDFLASSSWSDKMIKKIIKGV